MFDFIVVLISLVDIALELSQTTGRGLRVMRTFRLVSNEKILLKFFFSLLHFVVLYSSNIFFFVLVV